LILALSCRRVSILRLAAVFSLSRPLLAAAFSWLSNSRLAAVLSLSWPLLAAVFSWLSNSRLAALPFFSLGFPIHDLHSSVQYSDFYLLPLLLEIGAINSR
jgi:hypothetical protein